MGKKSEKGNDSDEVIVLSKNARREVASLLLNSISLFVDPCKVCNVDRDAKKAVKVNSKEPFKFACVLALSRSKGFTGEAFLVDTEELVSTKTKFLKFDSGPNRVRTNSFPEFLRN